MNAHTLSQSLRSLLVLAVTLGVALSAHARSEVWRPRPVGLPSSAAGVTATLEDAAGRTLPTWHHKGQTWVLGQQGQTYRVRVRNANPERVEVVVSVDGRDAVSGDPGDYTRQRGYVVAPYGDLVVDGFRQDLNHVAAFTFTTPGDSYSARRGTPQNVGVIGVAVFREAPGVAIAQPPMHRPTPIWPEPHGNTGRTGELGTSGDFGGFGAERNKASAPMSAPTQDMAEGASDAARARRGPAPRQNLGTQYGASQSSPTTEVPFQRATPNQPATVLGLYYDDTRGLRARGIQVDPPQPEGPQPFPVNRRFAPPPP